jgi:hypothetical protein
MTTIKLKNGSGAPDAADLVQGEVALDLTNKRIYSENASGTVIEMGTSPSTIDINAGTIDGVTMATSDITVGAGKTLDVSAGTLTLANDQISGDKIQGGTIGSVTISTLTATSADINGGTIDGVTIGGASAGAITGTTITGTSFVTSGDMTFGDNDKAIFGAGSDLQIYHDGADSRIVDAGTGRLIIGTNGTEISLRGQTFNENMIVAKQDAEVELYYDNAEKLATTATGIDVTGTVTADGLDIVAGSDPNVLIQNSVGQSTLKLTSSANSGDPLSKIEFVNTNTGSGETNAYIQGETNAGSGGRRDANIVFYTGGFADDNAANIVQRLRIADTGDISFYEDTGITPLFFWDASAESLGIGTTAPNYQLHATTTFAVGASGFNQHLSFTNDTIQSLVLGTGYTTLKLNPLGGNVGIGTTSPRGKVEIVGPASETSTLANAVTNAGLLIKPYSSSDWGLAFGSFTGQVQSIQGVDLGGSSSRSIAINALGGNVGIGTAAPSQNLHVAGNTLFATSSGSIESGFTSGGSNAYALLYAQSTSGTLYMGVNGTAAGSAVDVTGILDNASYFGSRTNHATQFLTNNTVRATIDTSGNLLVGTTSGSNHVIQKSAASDIALNINNSSATSPRGVSFTFSAASPNDGTATFFTTADSTAYRGGWLSNGGVQNYQANDSNLSDRREKTNFSPAKSYLETICAIPVQTFNYIDQNMEEDPGLTLGVVAQDVQEVAPELIMESNWGTEENPKMRLSIYQTDLQYALMKCIQELKAENDALKSRLDAAGL